MENIKTCSKCGKELPLEMFNKVKKNRLSSRCKDCEKLYKKWYKETHAEFIKERSKYFRERDPELTKKRKHEEYLRHSDKYKKRAKNHRLAHKEEKAHKDKIYRETHKEQIRERKRLYGRKVYKTNPQYVIKNQISHRIREAVKRQGYKKENKTQDLIGCTIPELIKHLESLFTDGMSWNNYGEWQIDHIIPCASFDLSDIEQQKKCFNYKNLQPLWAIDNQLKNDIMPDGVTRGHTVRGMNNV